MKHIGFAIASTAPTKKTRANRSVRVKTCKETLTLTNYVGFTSSAEGTVVLSGGTVVLCFAWNM